VHLPACGGERLVEPAGQAAKGLAPQESITLSSGLRDLDRLTKGLVPTSLIVVASRPSMGKSLLVFQIADHIARVQRRAVTMICARDGAATVAQRLIAVRAGVGGDAVIRGWQTDLDAQKRVQSAFVESHTIPILLADSRRLTVAQIANRASRFASERSVSLGAIILDGIDVFVSRRGRSPSAGIVAQLRSMAEEMAVPVIITAQVNRAVEYRSQYRRDFRPRITDFNKPYAAFVRDADVVLTIYRDEVYHIDSIDARLAELTLLRHRFGKPGTVRVRLGEGRFEDC